MLDTYHLLEKIEFPVVVRKQLDCLQINLGYRCNQQCLHCHVNAGPRRKEEMSAAVLNDVISFVTTHNISTVDLTGGAPEMHPGFVGFVEQLRQLDVKIIDRCNLTILNEPGYEQMAGFLAVNNVEVVASLPCYLEENVNKQRGKGVFESSIRALQKLNRLGYARNKSGLILNLVYNPQGPYLPPPQQQLETDYKKYLQENYDVQFNQLFTITNVPIKRFGSALVSKNEFNNYIALLRGSHQLCNMENLMCRNQVSIDWQGFVYDCDFNQMLDLPIKLQGKRMHISKMTPEILAEKQITVAGHCYACTAGQGSSCGGALSE